MEFPNTGVARNTRSPAGGVASKVRLLGWDPGSRSPPSASPGPDTQKGPGSAPQFPLLETGMDTAPYSQGWGAGDMGQPGKPRQLSLVERKGSLLTAVTITFLFAIL